jgi:hypothetical protein
MPIDPNINLEAIVVRSPMSMGGETKDQDRAFWSAASRTACVCDGVSSSPYAAEAAETCAAFSPALFRNEESLENNLGALSHFLEVHRAEAQRASLIPPQGASQEMQALLRDIATEKLQQSFQTTLVAVCVRTVAEALELSVVVVGDSAFFAYDCDGTPIASSLSPILAEPLDGEGMPDTQGIGVGYGDQIMAKVLGKASENPSLAKLAGLSEENAGSWLLCMPLDRCELGRTGERRGDRPERLMLRPNDVLVVPKYLVEPSRDPAFKAYCRLTYSKAVRSTRKQQDWVAPLRQKSPATAVLPDHYFTGNWSHFHEPLPANGSFVVASDGFYSCFANPADLWHWLNSNRKALHADPDREQVLQDLHAKLHRTCGDDDISFVWVRAGGGSPDGPILPAEN